MIYKHKLPESEVPQTTRSFGTTGGRDVTPTTTRKMSILGLEEEFNKSILGIHKNPLVTI